jgi:hypothetical protein
MVDGGAGAADPEVAVAEPVAAADIGSLGADVVISAACTALPQPAAAAAATRTSPDPISDRRDRLIPTAPH